MFGRRSRRPFTIRISAIVKPGVRFVQDRVRRSTPDAADGTDAGTFDADILVVALGADYDVAATPGLADGERVLLRGRRVAAPRRAGGVTSGGPVIVGVCGKSFKCPPAPSETALLLHDYLVSRGRRDAVDISLVMPFEHADSSLARHLCGASLAFAERGIEWVPGARVSSIEDGKAVLDDGSTQPFDLFLGVPKHRAPGVVQESGMAENGYIPVDGKTLSTKHPGVYAAGESSRR